MYPKITDEQYYKNLYFYRSWNVYAELCNM